MVYGGKPSLGCKECKRRRIKCDERRPTCLQCEKSRRKCPGFVDELDIIFKDQTVSVTEKAMRRRKSSNVRTELRTNQVCSSLDMTTSTPLKCSDGGRQRIVSTSYVPEDIGESTLDEEFIRELARLDTETSPSTTDSACSQMVVISSGTSSSISSSFASNEYAYLEPWLMTAPMLPLEDQAVAMYFQQIFCSHQTDRAKGWPIHLAPMYYAAEQDSAIRLSTSSAALAALSKRPETRHLGLYADKVYGRAMKAVQRALNDPAQCTTDETLQSTLSLAFYEISNPMNRSVKAWASHVEGAAAILATRGRAQFNTPQSLSLFRAVRTQMISYCILTGTAPKDLPFKGSWLADMETFGDPMHSLAQHIMRLPGLLARGKTLMAKELSPETVARIRELIGDCFEVDDRMKEWVPISGETWLPRTVGYISSVPKDLANAPAWIGPVHIFTDVQQPSTINKQRAARIVTAELILDCLKKILPDTYEDDLQFRKAQHTIQSAVDEICYSVPGLLGINSGMPNWCSEPSTPGVDFFASIGAFQLIWPTSVAYSAPGISDAQRQWLHGRLDVIGKRWGFEQALVMKNLLGQRRGLYEVQHAISEQQINE